MVRHRSPIPSSRVLAPTLIPKAAASVARNQTAGVAETGVRAPNLRALDSLGIVWPGSCKVGALTCDCVNRRSSRTPTTTAITYAAHVLVSPHLSPK